MGKRAKDKPQASLTDFSITEQEVENIVTPISGQDTESPSTVAAQIVNRNARAFRITISEYEFYWSEHILYYFIMINLRLGVYCSFARSRHFATFSRNIIFYHYSKQVLSSVAEYLKQQFPHLKFATLPSTFEPPQEFMSEGFYFSFTPSFLATEFLHRQKAVSLAPHHYFLRPSFDYTTSMVPTPMLLYDPNVFPVQELARYNLCNFEGDNVMHQIISNKVTLDVFAYGNQVTKKYYKARARSQEFFQECYSNHPFRYFPKLSEQ